MPYLVRASASSASVQLSFWSMFSYNSGLLGVSDAFRDCLWFANFLSTLAQNEATPARGILPPVPPGGGGHYKLVEHDDGAESGLLGGVHVWKELVGTKGGRADILAGTEGFGGAVIAHHIWMLREAK